MSKFTRQLMAQMRLAVILLSVGVLSAGAGTATYVLAALVDTSTFNQTITAGSLSAAIVDAAYAEVPSPSITMSGQTFSFSCQTSTGTFGTTSQQLYVQNPDAADGGWILNLAATTTTTTWSDGGSNTFDFNDSTGSPQGCTNGQMTVNPSGASYAKGNCATCGTTGISAGGSDSFVQTTVDDIDVMTGAAGSDDIGDWTLQSVSISQKIPGEKAAAAYSIQMKITVSTL